MHSSGWHLDPAAAKHTQCVAMGVGFNTRTFCGGGQQPVTREDCAKLLQKLNSCANLLAISKDKILSYKYCFEHSHRTVNRNMLIFAGGGRGEILM